MSNERARRRRVAQGRAPVVELEPIWNDDPICEEIDLADEEDYFLGLAGGHFETAKVIRSLDEEQVHRTELMKEAQEAYVDFLRLIRDPIDQGGRSHDLRMIPATMMAVAWTAILVGFRRTAKPLIKPRPAGGPGVYEDLQVWVDIRAADTPEEELRPDHSQDDTNLPPDLRAAAARRDGGEGMQPSVEWHTKAEVNHLFEPRPKDWDQ